MTREEFIEGYCGRSKASWAWLSVRREAIPCDCEEPECRGWQMAHVKRELNARCDRCGMYLEIVAKGRAAVKCAQCEDWSVVDSPMLDIDR